MGPVSSGWQIGWGSIWSTYNLFMDFSFSMVFPWGNHGGPERTESQWSLRDRELVVPKGPSFVGSLLGGAGLWCGLWSGGLGLQSGLSLFLLSFLLLLRLEHFVHSGLLTGYGLSPLEVHDPGE